jgi:RNA polymerase sigma-70 factor (ECF subfamily)
MKGVEIDFEQARPALTSFVRRLLPSPQDAEDVVQETFLKAFQARESFDGRASIKTWLYTIALNVVRDRARRPRPGALDDRGLAAPPDRSVERFELAERVRRLVQSLPDGQRAIFCLYRYEGVPYEEIARVLGVTIGTVKAQMHQALLKVRAGLEAFA